MIPYNNLTSLWSSDKNYNSNVALQNIHDTPPGGILVQISHPFGNSSLAFCFPLKPLALETPLPLGIVIGLLWSGYEYFLELHDIVTISPQESRGVLRRRVRSSKR